MVDDITELLTALVGQKNKVLISELLTDYETYLGYMCFCVYRCSVCLLHNLFAYMSSYFI